MDDKRAKHKACLDEMLRNLEATLKELQPKAKESGREAALRRWSIMLGVMMLNVGRTILRLIDTNDVVSATILSRSIYEYRISIEYFLKDSKTRTAAFEQFQAIVTIFVKEIKRLPTATPTVRERLDAMRDAWIKLGGKADPYSGSRAFTKMVLELAPPEMVKTDESGDKYTDEMVTSYGLPSWFAHGSAPLIGEFMPQWYEPDGWTVSMTPLNHPDILPIVRGVIKDLVAYLRTVRAHYDLPLYGLKSAVERSRDLVSPEIVRLAQAMNEKRRP
jgi:hypothetical protein